MLNSPVNSIRDSEIAEAPSGAHGIAKKSSGALSDEPVNLIMDRLGPVLVLIGILSGGFLGLLEASGSGIIASVFGPGFGLHGSGVLVYVMSSFAYGCIGGIVGLAVGLAVDTIIRIVLGVGSLVSN